MLRCGRVLVRVTFWLFATTTWHGTCTERKILSEIATAQFVKAHSVVPVPDVYGHDMDEDGVVGSAWIVMQYVDGDNLGLIWNDMSFKHRRQVGRNMADAFGELLKLQFSSIGSIYQKQEFYIGPLETGLIGGVHEIPSDSTKCGPFVNATDWLTAVSRKELGFIQRNKPLDFLERVEMRTQKLLDDLNSLSLPDYPIVLHHTDFSISNTLVSRADCTRIVALIDWEGARTVPLWAIDPDLNFPDLWREEENEEIRRVFKRHVLDHVPRWKDAMGPDSGKYRKAMVIAQGLRETRDGSVRPHGWESIMVS